MQTVNIYIDTSIHGPRRAAGDYLYILQTQTAAGPADLGGRKHLEETTENQAALRALREALEHMRAPCRLVIRMECRYVASALSNKWYQKWREHDWMTAKGSRVADAEIWQEILELLAAHEWEVRLGEPHEYREWMRRELKRREMPEKTR